VHWLIRNHPLFAEEHDDEFDRTYAWIAFRVPDESLEITRQLATGKEPPGMKELTDNAIRAMQALTPEQIRSDPRFKPLAEAIESIASGKTRIVKL
jgi:hypothetical protein